MDEMIIRWNNGKINYDESIGGTFKIELIANTFKFKRISGSAIPTDQLIGFLWFWPGLEKAREKAKNLRRINPWKVSRRDGMSGCSDWYIQFLDRLGFVRKTKTIIHSSMNGKQNEDIDVWVKDLYDVLWWMKKEGCFPSSFEGGPDPDCFAFLDITDEVISRRKEFNEGSLEPECGFGYEEALIDEDLLYKDHLNDYSNYTPTTEEKEEEVDDNGIRPVVPVSSNYRGKDGIRPVVPVSSKEDEDEFV